jgi:hypothetical protein
MPGRQAGTITYHTVFIAPRRIDCAARIWIGLTLFTAVMVGGNYSTGMQRPWLKPWFDR